MSLSCPVGIVVKRVFFMVHPSPPPKWRVSPNFIARLHIHFESLAHPTICSSLILFCLALFKCSLAFWSNYGLSVAEGLGKGACLLLQVTFLSPPRCSTSICWACSVYQHQGYNREPTDKCLWLRNLTFPLGEECQQISKQLR